MKIVKQFSNGKSIYKNRMKIMEAVVGNRADQHHEIDSRNTRQKGTCIMTNNTYTLKTNPNKYSNLHMCDQKYWSFTCDFSKAQDVQALTKSLDFVANRLNAIVKAKAFKPENIESAKELAKLVKAEADTLVAGVKSGSLDLAVETFKCYQIERYAFRLWYRDTKAAREATEPKAPKAEAKAKTPAKQEKPKAKAQPKAESKTKTKTTGTEDMLSMGKMTKAQKKQLVLALMAELLK